MVVKKFPGRKRGGSAPGKGPNLVDSPELVGLCRGVLADGQVTVTEARFILDWMEQRPELLETWPACDLHELLVKVLGDGKLSEEKQSELQGLLEEVIGDPVVLILH